MSKGSTSLRTIAPSSSSSSSSLPLLLKWDRSVSDDELTVSTKQVDVADMIDYAIRLEHRRE